MSSSAFEDMERHGEFHSRSMGGLRFLQCISDIPCYVSYSYREGKWYLPDNMMAESPFVMRYCLPTTWANLPVHYLTKDDSAGTVTQSTDIRQIVIAGSRVCVYDLVSHQVATHHVPTANPLLGRASSVPRHVGRNKGLNLISESSGRLRAWNLRFTHQDDGV